MYAFKWHSAFPMDTLLSLSYTQVHLFLAEPNTGQVSCLLLPTCDGDILSFLVPSLSSLLVFHVPFFRLHAVVLVSLVIGSLR